MLKKCISLFLLLVMLQNLNLTALAMEDRSSPSALLLTISQELEAARTKFLLIEDTHTGQITRAAYAELDEAFIRDGAVHVTFQRDGKQMEGRFVEPDLMKYVHETLPPKSKDAVSQGNDIGLNRLREFVKNKTGAVVVAVLDTGIDSEHPWFRGRLFSPYDMVEKDYAPQDLTGHGTHVCGIVAANTPPQVRIMPVRVFGDNGGASDYMIVKGIEYAVKNGADIINLSLGGYGTTSYLEKAIDYAYSKGVMIVTSAGNRAMDLSHEYPAAFPEVLTVGATGRDGDLLYYSNTGKELDLCAPGEKIESAAPGGKTQVKSGTSMAAPLVTSALAMLMLEDPSRSMDALEAILRAHTRDLGAAGRDPVFGYGELAFSRYQSDPDFYIMSPARPAPGQEEKFSMNLTMFVSERVSKMHFLVDGSLQQTSLVSKPGGADVMLNIRAFKPGPHTLEIRPVLRDGSNLKPTVVPFTIPEYNLRVNLYDILDQPVSQAELTLVGCSSEGAVEKIDSPFVLQNGTWMANLDYQQLAMRYDKVLCTVTAYPGGTSDYALYMRTTGVTGQKIYETSECSVLSISADGEAIGEGCTAVTRMLGEAFSGFDTETIWREDPNVYAVETGQTFIRTVPMDDSDGTKYYGLLFYDVADLWLEVYSTGAQPGGYPEAWQYLGFIRDIEEGEVLDSAQNPGLILKTDSQVAYPVIFSLRDVTSDKRLFGEFGSGSDRRVFPPGFYLFQAEPRRTLADGRRAWDFYKGGLDLTGAGDVSCSFGGSLTDELGSDADTGLILHQWRDAYGFSYQVMTEIQAGSGTYQAHIPRLILTNAAGKSYSVDGNALKDSREAFVHVYSIRNIPDGEYTVEFLYDPLVTAYQVKPFNQKVTLKGGSRVVSDNSPPAALSDQLDYLEPGSLLSRDLRDVFFDPDQELLRFQSDKGWIMDGTFYYRDLLNNDERIRLTAYDPSGASAVSTQWIKISDRMPAEPEYKPIPEIDCLGASNWATTIISDAITWDIVPVALLDLYQTNITREEFSELIVKAVERLRGPVRISAGKGFLDTSSEAVLKAASLGLLSGYKGIFSPREELSRQQLCVILYQTVKTLAPGKASMPPNGPRFTDADKIAPWAKEAVAFCHAKGIIVGSGGAANPSGSLSREQAIIMVYKTFVYLK